MAQCSAGSHLLPFILCASTLSLSSALSVSLGELLWWSPAATGWFSPLPCSCLYCNYHNGSEGPSLQQEQHQGHVEVSRLHLPAVLRRCRTLVPSNRAPCQQRGFTLYGRLWQLTESQQISGHFRHAASRELDDASERLHVEQAKDSRSSPTHTSLTQDRITTHFGCRAWLWMAWDVNEDEIMRSSGLDAVVSPESNEQCHSNA